MKNIYDYNENIRVMKTANGDAIITMNQPILDMIMNMLYDGAHKQWQDGHEATARDMQQLINTLVDKEKEANLW